MIPEPTIQELIDIAGKAVRGSADKNADYVRGSDYEALAGPSAVVWSRQAQRDTDLFNAVNFNTASGSDLTARALQRYGKVRVEDTRGTGKAMLQRPAGGTAETIWAGTRLMVPGSRAMLYRVTADKAVSALEVRAELDIEAVEIGPGYATDVGYGFAKLLDMAVDSAWVVASLRCGDGTVFEKAEDFRARIRRERFAERVGQSKAIIATCKAAGAANVETFRSNYAGDDYDHGLNVVYVGDLGHTGSPELVKACSLALEACRVAGDHLQVLPMARVELDITATVTLYAAPALFDLSRLERIHYAGLVQYLNGTSGRFTYSLDGLRGAIVRNTQEVQRAVLATPVADDQVVVGADKNFPATLNRYIPGKIVLKYQGP